MRTKVRCTKVGRVRLIPLAVALALVGAVVCSLDVAATPGARLLTLDQALEAAEASNPGYRRAGLAMDQAELALARLEADRSVKAGALALEQARGAVATARTARDAARRKLRLEARRAYYTLLTARRQQVVAREAMAQAEQQRRIILGHRGPGAATQLDVLNAERAVSEAVAGVQRADTGARLAELALLDLVGWPADVAVTLDEQAAGKPEPWPEEATAVSLALERSPEVRQAREGWQAARLSLSLTENDYTPDLSRKAAAARLADAALAVEEAERRVTLQVRRALAEARLAEAEVEVAAKTVAAATEGDRAARVRFDVGLSVTDELLTAQVRLFQARQAALQARLDLDLARATLDSLIRD